MDREVSCGVPRSTAEIEEGVVLSTAGSMSVDEGGDQSRGVAAAAGGVFGDLGGGVGAESCVVVSVMALWSRLSQRCGGRS